LRSGPHPRHGLCRPTRECWRQGAEGYHERGGLVWNSERPRAITSPAAPLQPARLRRVHTAGIEVSSAASFTPRDLASTAWSLARSACRDVPLMTSISAASIPSIALGSPWNSQDLANTAWSCANLRWADSPLLDAIAAASIRTISARSSEF